MPTVTLVSEAIADALNRDVTIDVDTPLERP